jgi:hypothetical protein
MNQPDWERYFFTRLAGTYLACRLAVMGGRPMTPHWSPVTDFESLGWHLLGMKDYGWSMRYAIRERLEKLRAGTEGREPADPAACDERPPSFQVSKQGL